MNQPLAYVHPGAKIAKNVVIEPFATIHNNVTIGEGSWIGSNVTIMEGARIGKNIPGRGDKQNVGAFFVVIGLAVDPGDLLDVLDEEFQHVFESVGLNAQVVSRPITVGHRGRDPVRIEAQEVEEPVAVPASSKQEQELPAQA